MGAVRKSLRGAPCCFSISMRSSPIRRSERSLISAAWLMESREESRP